MPFGLVSAGAVFQHIINEAPREALYHYAFVYLDDIKIFSSSLDEHVQKALQLPLQHWLFVKLEKSQLNIRS